jgi:probable HAF family extracellular repeat protein
MIGALPLLLCFPSKVVNIAIKTVDALAHLPFPKYVPVQSAEGKVMSAQYWALILCAVAVVGSAEARAEAPVYAFTTLDVPGASSTVARGINDAGQVVGFFSDGSGTHGFLLDAQGFTPIDVRGASSTEGRGINTDGQIVGDFTDSGGSTAFGYWWDLHPY